MRINVPCALTHWSRIPYRIIVLYSTRYARAHGLPYTYGVFKWTLNPQYTSIYPSAYRALPRQNELFRFFNSSFLEAPQAVPFHATATHCHHGMDFDDASFFVLRSELLVCPKFQATVSQRRSRNGQAS